MHVALLDPKRSYQALKSELNGAALRVLESGRYIMGPEVDAFETACAEYLGVKHAIGLSSGTDALLVALMALGVGPGDEVILPTYTFFATAGCIARLGATPVFVDSCAKCLNLHPDAVARKITKKTKALMPVHLFGRACELNALLNLAQAKNIPIIEDACQAIGAEYQGKKVGSLGSFGAFSFFPSKNLGAFGDAGLLTTNDDGLAETARALRSHGEKTRYDHVLLGGNFRIDALQAALLNVKLPHLDSVAQARSQHAALYSKLINNLDSAITLPEGSTPRHVWNQYVIRISGGHREALRNFLKEQGIDTAIYYPVPLHLQTALLHYGHKPGDFPVAEAAARDSLALPIYAELTDPEIHYVAEQINAFTKLNRSRR